MPSPGSGFILHLVAASRWSGAAAPALDSVVALRRDGWDARLGYLGGNNLEKRLEGIPWAVPLLTKPRALWHVTDDIARLREVFDRGCALVHCHMNTDHLYAAVALRRRRDIPLVRTFHHESHARRDLLHRWAFRRATRFLAVTSSVERALLPNLPPGIPRQVVHESVDPSRFSLRPRRTDLAASLSLPPASFVVIHVGKVERGRGQDLAIDVTSTLAGLGIDVALLLVGKGPALEATRKRAAERGIGDRVVFAGYREEDLPELYHLADAAIFPAPGSDRGHRMILESLASGLPVVSLGVAGSEEIIRHGINGYVTPPQDIVAAAEALAQIAREPGRRQKMSDAARKSVLETFADPIIARGLGAIYEEIFAATAIAK